MTSNDNSYYFFLTRENKFSPPFSIINDGKMVNFQLLRDIDWSELYDLEEKFKVDFVIAKKLQTDKNIYDIYERFKLNKENNFKIIELDYQVNPNEITQNNDSIKYSFSLYDYNDKIMCYCPFITIDKRSLNDMLF